MTDYVKKDLVEDDKMKLSSSEFKLDRDLIRTDYKIGFGCATA